MSESRKNGSVVVFLPTDDNEETEQNAGNRKKEENKEKEKEEEEEQEETDIVNDGPAHKHYSTRRRAYLKVRRVSKVPSSRTIVSARRSNNVGFQLDSKLKRALSISSESNTSQTEMQGYSLEHMTSAPWHSGCCIWINQVLSSAIEGLINLQDFSLARVARLSLDNEADEFVWNQLPNECLYIGVLYAALKGSPAMLNCFLQRGGDAEAHDSTLRTALHYAASSASSEAVACIKLLIQHGADINAWDLDGQATPLICAAASGRIDIVDALLKANADVNAGLADSKYPDRSSALVWAVRARSFVCASRLIDAGAAVNSLQVYSETPIHVAASQGDDECLKLLLQKNADVRVLYGSDRRNPLHLAAAEGNVGCIRLLLNTSKTDINAGDARGLTPLHLAALSQSVESVSELIVNGARVDISDETKKTALHSAVIKSSRSTDVVRVLLAAGADINARDETEQTPLHLAAINENSKLANVLILSGADLSAKNKGGNSALSFVVRRVPDALSAIPRRLDSAVLLSEHDPADPDCELQLDFRVMVLGGDQEQVGEMSLMTALVAAEQQHILQHPVIRAFLHLKWFKIRLLFMISLFFYASFILSITFTIFSAYVYDRSSNESMTNDSSLLIGNDSMPIVGNLTINDLEFFKRLWPWWAVEIINYLTIVYAILAAFKELFQVWRNPQEYLSDVENIPQFILITGTVIVCIPAVTGKHDQWQQHLAAIIIIIGWLNLMMYVGRFPGNSHFPFYEIDENTKNYLFHLVLGLYVQMFKTVAKNIGKLLSAYVCLIIGFSLGFAVLFPHTTTYARMPHAVLKTFVMMTGELEYNSIFIEEDDLKYYGTTHLVFLAFILFIVVVLMNLLVGLAVSDIQGLQKSAGLDRLVRQTRLIARLESFIFFPWLNYLPCWTGLLRVLLQRKVLVVLPNLKRGYSFRPNDPRDSRFPPDIKDNLLKIIHHNKALKSGNHTSIYRTKTMTPMTPVVDVSNRELLDEVVNRVDELFHNYMSQIIMINTTLDEKLAQVERYMSMASQETLEC